MLLGEARQESDGYLTYVDDPGPAGGTFEYRVSVTTESGKFASDVVRMQVPGIAGVLAITLPRQPLRPMDRVRITLPVADNVTLELFDVTGRQIGGAKLEDLPPGSHELPLSRLGAWRPGVAFLRLRQGTQSSATRVVLLP